MEAPGGLTVLTDGIGIPCLTLLVSRMMSLKLANDLAHYGAP